MANWKDIVAANAAIKPTTIHNKDYAEVNQRVKAFRMVYPTGFIKTEMTSNIDGICVFRVEVGYYTDEGKEVFLANGTAFECRNSSKINQTSYIENCETSAVGRALGMAGFGIDTSIASAEEMQNALNQQEQQQKPQPKKESKVQEPPKTEPYSTIGESDEDLQLRIDWLNKFGEQAMEAACRRKFGTGFAETPIDKIKQVMPKE